MYYLSQESFLNLFYLVYHTQIYIYNPRRGILFIQNYYFFVTFFKKVLAFFIFFIYNIFCAYEVHLVSAISSVGRAPDS